FAAAGFSQYYLDIPDSRSVIAVGVELWVVTILWDTKILGQSYVYTVGTGSEANPTDIITVADGDGDWVQLATQTVGMKRVNTLAIYEEGRFVAGHYPILERFVVVVLGVSGTQGPFQKGVNVLVIPVSLFLHTQLHSMWEHEELPEALTEASESGLGAEFYGIDPDAESVSQYVEGLILKGLEEGDYVTPQEALAILATLLRNETDEEIYSYYICTEAGAVERLGLAADILALIPFDAQAMASDPAGALPKGFWDWVISIVVTILLILVFAALAPFLFLGALVGALIYLGITLLGPLLAAAALAALKMFIYILILISLALFLLNILISFLVILVLFSMFAEIIDGTLLIEIFYIRLNYKERSLSWKFRIEWQNNPYWQIWIPFGMTIYNFNEQECWTIRNNIMTGESESKIFQMVTTELEISEAEFKHELFDFGLSLVFGILGICLFVFNYNAQVAFYLFAGMFIGLLITALSIDKAFSKGLAWGFLIAYLVMLIGIFVSEVIPSPPEIWQNLIKMVDIILFIFTIIAIFLGITALIISAETLLGLIIQKLDDIFSYPYLVFIIFIFAVISAGLTSKKDELKKTLLMALWILCTFFAIIFIGIGYT
ncbi:MAG: hypothetical protein ACTSRL_17425, partial [Candidatus Helarchaeota archaeon]